MKEVIQDFLNLPGIAGVALIDGRSRPYFLGIDETLNFQQREALAQGILQVIETIPKGFESFEFQFTGYQVHIYKLNNGIVLLVLTRSDLVYSDYLKTIKNLKTAFHKDRVNLIASFRLIAGTVTHSDVHSNTGSSRSQTAASLRVDASSVLPSLDLPALDLASKPAASTSTPQPTPPSNEAPTLSLDTEPKEARVTVEPTLERVLSALNHLTLYTTKYLGKHVVVNYWKSTQPDCEWLSHFEIDRSATFSCPIRGPEELHRVLTPQEQEWIQTWVAAFVDRCAQVVRDFPAVVRKTALSPEQQLLLLK